MEDTAERVTVVGVKSDGKKFKATRPNGEVQEFTLSVSNPVVCPAMNDDIIVHFSIKTPTDPDKIARFGSAPTFWVNKIEPARSGPADQGQYEQPPTDAWEQTAQRVDATNAAAAGTAMPDRPQEIATPKKDVYQEEANTRERSTEWNTAVMTAREVLVANQGWEQEHVSITGDQIAEMARDIYYGKELPTHPEQEPEPEYTA